MSFGIHAEEGRTLAPKADQHDAMLMVELFKLAHSQEMLEDWEWFTGEFNVRTWPTLKKNYPPGSEGSIRLRRLLDFWEMVGAFVEHKVLDASLLFDVTLDPARLWPLVEPWIGAARKELGANQWAHLEELAARATAYVNGE